jgi:tetratricopeptide (TPR) repeat protein
MRFSLPAAAFLAVVAAYAFLASMGISDRGPYHRDAAYNLLARGLLSGHLYLAKEVPPMLLRAKDPYDPVENKAVRFGGSDSPNGVHDFSYYRGRLYLQFGVAPALLFFAPAHLLTGTWLPHWLAVLFFCAVGLWANVSLVSRIRDEAFPQAGPRLMAACVLILGLASYAPLVLSRADMWQVAISCSYCLVSLALRFLWEALGKPARPAGWIALASAALGLAFAARAPAITAAPILLAPFAFRAARASLRAWLAAALPLGACAAVVALYNDLRFGSPFEFGSRYQLAGEYVSRVQAFSAGYVWANLRLYLFQPVGWAEHFPFLKESAIGPLPEGHGGVEHISGCLLLAPVLLCALAVPPCLRAARPGRRILLAACSAAWIAASSLALLSIFFGTCARYQFEFVPPLALLAALGLLAVECGWKGPRLALARAFWIPAALFSCACVFLYGVDMLVMDHREEARAYLSLGNIYAAERELAQAQFLSPGDPATRILDGLLLFNVGRRAESEEQFRELEGDDPGDPDVYVNWAQILLAEQRRDEALACYQKALGMSAGNPSYQAQVQAAIANVK